MALVRWKWKVAWKCSSNPACTGECHASSTKKLVLQKNVRWFSLLCYSGQSFGTPRLQNQMSLWLWLDLFVSLKQKGKMWPPLPIHQGQRSEWHWVWLGDPFYCYSALLVASLFLLSEKKRWLRPKTRLHTLTPTEMKAIETFNFELRPC